MNEPWLKILREWQKVHEALTIPFLIGALREPPGASASKGPSGIAEIRALVDSIRSHRASGYYHYIRPCDKVGNHLALTRIPSTYPPEGTFAITPDSDKANCSLYARIVNDAAASPVERLTMALWTEFEPCISKGLFSYRGNDFRPFDDDDLRLIDVALNSSAP
jgi:hypothetical protein